MELNYWSGDSKFGLPSIDITSLELLAYLKFVKANVKLHPTERSWFFTKSSYLPCLETSDGIILTNTHEIYQHLRLKFYDLDNGLPEEDKMKVMALKSLIKDKLLFALNSFLWVDAVNYAEYSRGTYGSRCSYPLNFFVPQQKRDEFLSLLTEKKKWIVDFSKVSDNVHDEALEVLELFDEYLDGKNEYLFGNSPSSVDACLFSCLAILTKVNLPNCKLQQRIRNKHNISRYVNFISKEHFTDEIAANQKETVEAAVEEESDKYEWVFPVAVATVAMVSYAINIGLIQSSR